MIKYDQGTFGFVALFRLHGSALYKSTIPALLSSAIYVALWVATDIGTSQDNVLSNSYAVGALLASLTFILTFRVSNSYTRWWEAYTSVTMMQSKLLDVGTTLASYHFQSKRYDMIRPPSLGNRYDAVDAEDPQGTSRTRARTREMSMHQLQEQIKSLEAKVEESPRRDRRHERRRWLARLGFSAPPPSKVPPATEDRDGSADPNVHRDATTADHPTAGPSPFLEEATHLLSLLSAVAFSTLRNDVEGTEVPLIAFDPSEPFPHVDPDSYEADVRKEFVAVDASLAVRIARYVLGAERTPMNRTLYNAARPFRVMGGVSDGEITLLQDPRCSGDGGSGCRTGARGPSARVAVVQGWLQEFVTREYLAGSLGDVPPPLVAVVMSFVSDAMTGYHHAQKVAYVPFPFVHAQLTSFFVLVAAGIVPVLMVEYVSDVALGFILNLLTVMSFTGLHEVARELENPFQNAPNDVPLNNFQVQFNHGLLSTTLGMMYHHQYPDVAAVRPPHLSSSISAVDSTV